MQKYTIRTGGYLQLNVFVADSPEDALDQLARSRNYCCYKEFYWYDQRNLHVYGEDGKYVTDSIRYGQGSNYRQPIYGQIWSPSK